MHLAWHIAVLSRSKKMPRLRELLIGEKPKQRKIQSWQEQLAIASNWTGRKKK